MTDRVRGSDGGVWVERLISPGEIGDSMSFDLRLTVRTLCRDEMLEREDSISDLWSTVKSSLPTLNHLGRFRALLGLSRRPSRCDVLGG